MTGIAVGYSKAQTVDEAFGSGLIKILDSSNPVDGSDLQISSYPENEESWSKSYTFDFVGLYRSINDPASMTFYLRNNIPDPGFEGNVLHKYNMESRNISDSGTASNIHLTVSIVGEGIKESTEIYNGTLADFNGLEELNYIPVDYVVDQYGNPNAPTAITATFSLINTELGNNGDLYYEFVFTQVI